VDGFKQAQALGRYLKGKGVVHIFCSPFLRTVQTAHCVAEILNLSIKIESGLSEFLLPLWLPPGAEEFSIEELASQFPRIDVQYTSCVWAKYPEMTWLQVQKRAGNTVNHLVQNFSETILIIGHEPSVIGAVRGLVKVAPTVDASKLCCLFKVVQTNLDWNLENHDYTPNPETDSSHLPFAYYQNHLKRRLLSIFD
jgi:broad specificity phosphatase PhoE